MPFDPVGYVETKIVDADGEVLRRAADIIEQRGLSVGAGSWHSGPVCLMQAILLARDGTGAGAVFDKNTHSLTKALGFGADSTADLVAAFWSDDQRGAAPPVIARLRSAAEQGAS